MIKMSRILSKLIRCIHRNEISKAMKSPLSNSFLKLSRFELMPDEILIEIFEYLPLSDLYQGFVHLNFRLNLLLRDVRIGISLNEQITSEMICYFAKQIVYLHLDKNPLIQFNSFSRLRSLIIYFPTPNQILAINHRLMPNLTRLWIGFIHPNDENILWRNLFGNKQMLKLNSCFFFQIQLNENIHFYQKSFSIQILSITNIKTKDLLFILSLLPNLYQLQICISDVYVSSFNQLTKIYHPKLRILKIEFMKNLFQLKHLNFILSFVPDLNQLNLSLANLIQSKDYLFLQKIILENLFQLKQFECSIDYFCQLSSNRMINKFQQFILQMPFFQTMKILPCHIHHDKCLRKTFMNKTLIPTF